MSDQLITKKSLLTERNERLSEVEGQIKILRNKGSSTIFA